MTLSAVVQELGREGVLPFSKLWASNWPFYSPAAGLFEHYLVSAVIMLAPPPGDAYNFLLKYVLIPYPSYEHEFDKIQSHFLPSFDHQCLRLRWSHLYLRFQKGEISRLGPWNTRNTPSRHFLLLVEYLPGYCAVHPTFG